MNDIDFVFTLLLGFVAGVIVTRIYIGILARHMIQRLTEAMEQQSQPEAKTTVETRVELIDDMFLVYRLDNNEFVGQGRTIEELKERCLARFRNPNLHIKITQGNEEALERLKNQL